MSIHLTSSSYFEPQGKEASGVKPLVFPVTVSSKVRRSGAPAALDRLQASRYMNVSAVQDQCPTNSLLNVFIVTIVFAYRNLFLFLPLSP